LKATRRATSGCCATVNRAAIYVATSVPGERERLEARRQQLIAGEDSLGFDPGRNADDLAVLREMLGGGSVSRRP
jgi:hypothetical protein